MNEPMVLGAILRADVCGWDGPPPHLPGDPIRIDEHARGSKSFVYDLLPRHSCVSVSDACHRVAAVIESLLENWPLRDLAFPARCRLDVGLVVENPAVPFKSDWPAAFLSALAEAEIELGLSFYPADGDAP